MLVPRSPAGLQEYPWKWYQVGERRFWRFCLACHQAAWHEARESCCACCPSRRRPFADCLFTARQDGRCANRHCKPRGDRCVFPLLQRRLQVGTFYLTQAPPELAARVLNYLLTPRTKHPQMYLRLLKRSFARPVSKPLSHALHFCPAQTCPGEALHCRVVLPRPAMSRPSRL